MLAPWRSLLASAIHRNRSKPHSRYFQLATVSAEGIPRNRTVVFRGFADDEQNRLKMITDARSAKINEIQHQAIAEVCWYFTKTREQFRITGELYLVTTKETDPLLQQARQTTWHNLSDPARSQFAWPTPAETAADPSAFNVESPDKHTPLENFCLLLLTPEKIDHLQLKGEPQQRHLYNRQSNLTWISQAVNP
ncbi:MAG: Npun_F5749 family FMN-dependent PPOX-type flavoprotein [Cyanobacteria bacterium J06600_6]